MNRVFVYFVAALPLALGSASLAAGDADGEFVEKVVIALKTDDFDLQETDISHLAVGDAETIHTESGRTVDILRTEDGVEVYIDGELVDAGGPGVHREHKVVHKLIQVRCAEDGACDETVWLSDADDLDPAARHGEHHDAQVIVIRESEEVN